MNATLSLKGIDEAIANLNYRNPQALKYKLVHAVRGLYQNESPLESLKQIDPDTLIKAMWDTGLDPAAVKTKRKNLSSTKSSVNADLKKLLKEAKNPDGVIIGRDNVFVMSDEAKDKLISAIGGNDPEGQSASLQEIAQALHAVKEALSNPEMLKAHSPQASAAMQDLRKTMQDLSRRIGPGDNESIAAAQDSPAEMLDGSGSQETADASEKKTTDRSPDGFEAVVGGKAVFDETGSAEGLEEPAEPAFNEIAAPDPARDRGGVHDAGEVDEVLEADDALEEFDTIEDDDLEDVFEAIDPDQVDEDAQASREDPDFDEEDSEEVFDDVAPDDDLQDVELEQEAGTCEDIEAPDTMVDDAEMFDEVLEADDAPEEFDTIEDDDLEDVFETLDGDDVDDEPPASDQAPEVGDNTIEGGAGALDVFDGGNGAETTQGVGLPGIRQEAPEEESGLDENTDGNKRKRLAEIFDGYLGTMERFYNQYLVVPAGNYRLGSKSPKKEERPEQTVRMASFYMGKFPVTNALFEVFVEKTGYITTAEKAGFGTVYYGRLHKETDNRAGTVRFRCNSTVQSKTVQGAYWYQPFGPGSTLHLKKAHPVVQVSLADAMAFAAWTGKRLPSEDEWEAAARTEKGYIYPWGDDWQADACNTEDVAVADTTQVDTFQEMTNMFGMVDTLGNVLEWTSDIFPSAHNPSDSDRYRVAKGGSWVSGKNVCLFSRFKVKADAPSNILGFRCVAD